MANFVIYKEKKIFVGDTVSVVSKIKEEDKEKQQIFKGILIRVKGMDGNNKMITVRKISRTGIGVEKIIPLYSPNIVDIKIVKNSTSRRSKIYYIRNLTERELKYKLYRQK